MQRFFIGVLRQVLDITSAGAQHGRIAFKHRANIRHDQRRVEGKTSDDRLDVSRPLHGALVVLTIHPAAHRNGKEIVQRYPGKETEYRIEWISSDICVYNVYIYIYNIIQIHADTTYTYIVHPRTTYHHRRRRHHHRHRRHRHQQQQQPQPQPESLRRRQWCDDDDATTKLICFPTLPLAKGWHFHQKTFPRPHKKLNFCKRHMLMCLSVQQCSCSI